MDVNRRNQVVQFVLCGREWWQEVENDGGCCCSSRSPAEAAATARAFFGVGLVHDDRGGSGLLLYFNFVMGHGVPKLNIGHYPN